MSLLLKPVRRDGLVVVTGGASGIGRATARAFSARGATVVVADIDLEGAAATVAGLNRLGHAYRLDVAHVDEWERFASTVLATHGVPDVMVNNAGIGMGGPFLEHTAADWRRIVDVNLLGMVHGSRLFGAPMAAANSNPAGGRGERRRRQIVNLASASGFSPNRGMAAYSTTKAGVMAMSACARADLAAAGVGVSVICPGFVATNIYRSSHFVGVDEETAAERAAVIDRVAAPRMPGPEVVAAKILDAVDGNRPVVVVTAPAHVLYVLAHVCPPAVRALARLGDTRSFPRFERLRRR
jgi:NAD(P)-dependent dehydrogenase (short-subunit alcohol dehydrogenase family)